MQLKPNSTLQDGKYVIIRSLGQGGFGITYEAEHAALHRIVAVKEFFMKDCCDRDMTNSQVTVGTGTQRDLVAKFRGKFIREAQMMASLDHPHIVRVLDVFEENGTAYYVMGYLPGGSLAAKVSSGGPLSEEQAKEYIRQVADALAYIHAQNTVHLDIKPSNILLNAKGEAVLIDFGVSKHYDSAGEQTSSTPVGISKGYAPLEQNRDGDVSQFKPSTDIYALGATLYFLVTGVAPPEASIVNEDGLERPEGISGNLWHAIEQAMQPRRKDRPQSISEFLALIDTPTPSVEITTPPTGEETVVIQDSGEETILPQRHQLHPATSQMPQPILETNSESVPVSPPILASNPDGRNTNKLLWALLAGLVIIGVLLGLILGGKKKRPDTPVIQKDSTEVVITEQQESMQEELPRQSISGSLKVSSDPAGATIWLDGKNTRKVTPDILEELSPGKHSIKLVMEGYSDYSGSVTIKGNERMDWSGTLNAKEPDVPRVPAQTTQRGEGPSERERPRNDTQESANTTNRSELAVVELEEDVTEPATGMTNGHEWADLGLRVKWATCNVGATSPTDYGSFFAWGETSTKSSYTWSNLRYCTDDRGYSFSKYNTQSDFGTVDNKARLDMSDDAARINWGSRWRMPTKAELDELRMKCNFTWTTQGGRRGYRVTSNVNGNSIFLPAAGYRDGSSTQGSGSYGYYWTSSLVTDSPYYAQYYYFDASGFGAGTEDRNRGFSIRPVIE